MKKLLKKVMIFCFSHLTQSTKKKTRTAEETQQNKQTNKIILKILSKYIFLLKNDIKSYLFEL